MDLVTPVRVVIVDDKPTHLFSIANGLTLAGIPCVWHWYNARENTLVPKPPEGGYPHLRMLFTDLNIREMVGANKEAKTLAGTLISDVLQPIVSPTSGPYSLVLWTSVEGAAAEVSSIISERIDAEAVEPHDRRPKPLTIDFLPKKEFLAGAENEVDDKMSHLITEAAKNAARIKKLVEDVASVDKQLRVACAWESRAGLAATETINTVYGAAVLEAQAAKLSPSEALQKLFARIAYEALGKNAKDEPALALDEGLIDIFVDDMRYSRASGDYAALVRAALDKPLGTRPQPVSSDARSLLNTFLQIEHPIRASDRLARGVVLTMMDEHLMEVTGSKGAGLLWDEFLVHPKMLAKELEKQNSEALKERYTFCLENKERVEKEAKIVVLEIGADCDHAQRSPRTIRLLWALELPLELASFAQPWDDQRRMKHDALVSLGPWSIDERAVLLIVSVKRFAIQQDWLLGQHMKAQYRLRKPLVDLILHKYSAYSTRPGIISITN